MKSFEPVSKTYKVFSAGISCLVSILATLAAGIVVWTLTHRVFDIIVFSCLTIFFVSVTYLFYKLMLQFFTKFKIVNNNAVVCIQGIGKNAKEVELNPELIKNFKVTYRFDSVSLKVIDVILDTKQGEIRINSLSMNQFRGISKALQLKS